MVSTVNSGSNGTMTAVETSAARSQSVPTPSGVVAQATPREVVQWLRAGEAVVIDVREPDEYAIEHIKGTKLIPLSRFDPQQAAALVRPGQRLVFQCRSGRRSENAARTMAAFSSGSDMEIYNLAGGIEGWKKEGLPVEVKQQASGISVLRQTQLVIGIFVLTGSALAWFVSPIFIGIPAFFGAGLVVAGVTGTCGLAALIARMPWNRVDGQPGECADGKCE